MFAYRRAAGPAAACFGLWLIVLALPALAQPSQAQQNAVRSNCRSDYMANCSSVKPGGPEALQCLQKNMAKLSASCRTAVSAITPPPPPPAPAAAAAPAPAAAAAPAAARPAGAPAGAPTQEQREALRQFCGADYLAKCGHVAPGGPEALQCLQSHSSELSPNCRGALALFGAGGTGSAPAQVATPAPAAAAPAAPAAAPAARPAQPRPASPPPAAAGAPSPQQQAAVRQSCQSDFMAKCAGVQPGGSAALQCLQRNSATLSPTCRNALASLGGSPGASAAPAAAASPPTADQQAAIKRTCQRDFMSNCRGVQPGGPEALQCLQRNADRLSPDCRTSLAAIGGGGAASSAASAPPPPPPAAERPVGPLRRVLRERMMDR